MSLSDIKRLLINSLDEVDLHKVPDLLEKEGLSYDFSPDFTQKVLNAIFPLQIKVYREIEFSKYLSFVFSRVALSGIAAILVLLLSIFLMEGSLSVNSLLGLNDGFDESIVYLLTGN